MKLLTLLLLTNNSRQLRNLEKIFGGDVRVCDRTALILDIFNQRAATHEASLQAITYLSCLAFSHFIIMTSLGG